MENSNFQIDGLGRGIWREAWDWRGALGVTLTPGRELGVRAIAILSSDSLSGGKLSLFGVTFTPGWNIRRKFGVAWIFRL